MEPTVRIELTTDGLQNHCSTTELCWQKVAPPLGFEPRYYVLTGRSISVMVERN